MGRFGVKKIKLKTHVLFKMIDMFVAAAMVAMIVWVGYVLYTSEFGKTSPYHRDAFHPHLILK